MGKYSGMSCPICGQPFTDRDEISVCPDCGAPHHRDCVIAAGKCAFADRHGAGYTWQPSEESKTDTLPLRCGRCGAENEPHALFCVSCGSPLGKEPEEGVPFRDPQPPHANGGNPFVTPPFAAFYRPVQPEMQPEDAMEEDVTYREAAAYVGQNVPYFLTVFYHARQGKRVSFNWSAFLLGYIYLFYRKMYAVATAVLAATALLSIPSILVMMLDFGVAQFSVDEHLLGMLYQGAALLSFLIRILVGFFANRLYDRQTVRKIRRVRAATDPVNREEYYQAIAQKGGVSYTVVLLIAAGTMVLTYISMFLLAL